MSTVSVKPADVQREWFLVDAEGLVLGRISTRIATVLMGKHKPTFTPHVDTGDFVVVVNCEKIKLTGNKLQDKVYYHHTGYPGGIRSRTAGRMLASSRPEEVVSKAIERMIPKGPLGRQQIRNLKVYAGAEHPHEAQQPINLDVGAMNPKNKRSSVRG